MLVLAADVHQALDNLTQRRHGREAPVDEHLAAALGGHHPADEQAPRIIADEIALLEAGAHDRMG